MLQPIPSFYAKYSKNDLFFCKMIRIFYEHYFVSKEYCIARYDDKMCFLLNWRHQFSLLGKIEELLQKLNPLCFTYQHVDCFYTLPKNHFSGNIVVNSRQVFDNVQRAVYFNQRNRRVDRMPSISKKRFLRKRCRKHLLSSFQKTKSTETSGSVFAKQIKKLNKLKELNTNWS